MSRIARLGFLYLCLGAGTLPAPVGAQPAPAAQVGKVDGALLMRTPKRAWQALASGAAIPDGALVVALPQAELVAPDGAVQALMLADLGQRTAFPVLESAFTLHAPKQTDLDLGLDRGIVGLMNAKKEGAAKVRLRFRDQNWLLTLKTPDTRVGVEIYSRHVPGLRRVLDRREEPVTNIVFLVTRGKAFLDLGEQGYALEAPPGTALLMWDNLTRTAELRHLDKAPRSLRDLDAKEAATFEKICAAAKRLTEGKLPEAAAALVGSAQKSERLVGVTALGALDDLPHLLDALADAQPAEVRQQAVLVLRHWLGRGPGQAEDLYQALRQHGSSEPLARTILQLLYGFSAAERAQPATYDLLLGYLAHSQLPVRQLAYWHLVRLAPAGKDIPYDPAGDAMARAQAIRAWRALIPAGELPRPPAASKNP
jgi:hypothetical protein